MVVRLGEPDILLMQETKLADADAPIKAFKQAGYGLVHHGEGRWNGVAISEPHRRCDHEFRRAIRADATRLTPATTNRRPRPG